MVREPVVKENVDPDRDISASNITFQIIFIMLPEKSIYE